MYKIRAKAFGSIRLRRDYCALSVFVLSCRDTDFFNKWFLMFWNGMSNNRVRIMDKITIQVSSPRLIWNRTLVDGDQLRCAVSFNRTARSGESSRKDRRTRQSIFQFSCILNSPSRWRTRSDWRCEFARRWTGRSGTASSRRRSWSSWSRGILASWTACSVSLQFTRALWVVHRSVVTLLKITLRGCSADQRSKLSASVGSDTRQIPLITSTEFEQGFEAIMRRAIAKRWSSIYAHFQPLTVRIAGVLRYHHPDEQGAPSDRRERVVDSGMDRIVYVIDAAHLGGTDERCQEHHDADDPADVEGCLKSPRGISDAKMRESRGRDATPLTVLSLRSLGRFRSR